MIKEVRMAKYTEIELLKKTKLQRMGISFVEFFKSIPSKFKKLGLSEEEAKKRVDELGEALVNKTKASRVSSLAEEAANKVTKKYFIIVYLY